MLFASATTFDVYHNFYLIKVERKVGKQWKFCWPTGTIRVLKHSLASHGRTTIWWNCFSPQHPLTAPSLLDAFTWTSRFWNRVRDSTLCVPPMFRGRPTVCENSTTLIQHTVFYCCATCATHVIVVWFFNLLCNRRWWNGQWCLFLGKVIITPLSYNNACFISLIILINLGVYFQF